MLKKEKTFISKGDFLDLYHKAKQKGFGKLLSILNPNAHSRVSGKWDTYRSSSDFWNIPEIKRQWNQKISGNAQEEYEDYVVKTYLEDKRGLKLLSVGCGEGSHERRFATYPCFSKIIGVDVSKKRIEKASKMARKKNLPITYFSDDFRKIDFENGPFDLILFSSSLHHFDNLKLFLKNEVKPLLKDSGIIVVFEYCGPDRLQWKDSQLKEANRLLKELPEKYRLLGDGKTLKTKVYRPGLLRMFLMDPSEAPDSSNLIDALHQNFSVVEEQKLGWNLLHLLLKGIAQNFIDTTLKTHEILNYLIQKEEDFIKKSGGTDGVFGVYKK